MGKTGAAVVVLTSLVILSPTVSLAAQTQSFNGGVHSELRLSTGLLNGESGEYVYDAYGLASGIPGYKISELDWELNDVNMVGLGVSFTPVPWFRLNADYWVNATDGGGTMDDYDWLYVGLDWSHWSHHDNTTVTEVSSIDVNGEFTLFRFDNDTTSITALAGFKQDNMAWQAVGGYGIYSDILNLGYRDLLVVFPNIPGITYEQTFNMPYVGLGIQSTGKSGSTPITLSASYRYSNQVHGEDVDIHHLRNLQFEESGDDGVWKAIDIKLDFRLSKALTLNIAYASQEYEEIKATTTVTDMTAGTTTFYPGPSAGLDHRSNMISLGMSYLF